MDEGNADEVAHSEKNAILKLRRKSTSGDGTEVINITKGELTEEIAELRGRALTMCYGEPVSNALQTEIHTLATRILDSQPAASNSFESEQEASILIEPEESKDEYWSVELHRRTPKDETGGRAVSSELHLIRRYLNGTGGVNLEYGLSVWLEPYNLPAVNIDKRGLRATYSEQSANSVFLGLVDGELGMEEGAIFNQQPGGHGIYEKSMDEMTFGDAGTPIRRFPSLQDYDDQLPFVGEHRSLREQDTRYVNMVVDALRTGKVDENREMQNQLRARLESGFIAGDV